MSGGVKRILSSIIILPTVLAVFILGNKYIIDVFISIIATRCTYELFNAFKQKGHHPVEILGYISSITICFLHIIPEEHILLFLEAIIITTIVISFIFVITKKTKTDFIDLAITFFSICYIVIFLLFVSLIRNDLEEGKFLIWYMFLASWITDVFAYIIGKAIGKYHFTEISPNKTIEGSIGGIVGAVVSMCIYTTVLNNLYGFNINYIVIILAGIALSIIGQIGDLAASAIKRYVGIKDYSNLIPGHGGMLDRIDSIIFVAPFIYFIFKLI